MKFGKHASAPLLALKVAALAVLCVYLASSVALIVDGVREAAKFAQVVK